MEISITVRMDSERHKALKKYLKRKANSTVEQELEYALTRLYDKYVPVTVREYLEEGDEDTGEERETERSVPLFFSTERRKEPRPKWITTKRFWPCGGPTSWRLPPTSTGRWTISKPALPFSPGG